MARCWKDVRFGPLRVETKDGQLEFDVQVYLGGLTTDAVRVELFANAQDGDEPFVQPMDRGEQLAGAANGYWYSTRTPATRPASDFTSRVVPYHPAASVPLEASQILWQR